MYKRQGCSVLQMPYTVLVSFIVGVTNVIPYFGPFIGAIPSIFIIMIADPLKSLVLAVFVLILQQLDGNIIGPKILGDSTGLSAFWVIFAVTFFGGLFGFVGMLIGVPTFAVIYALVRNFAEFKLGKKGLKTQTPDFASQENPIFQKVRYHHSEQAPHTGVEVFDPVSYTHRSALGPVHSRRKKRRAFCIFKSKLRSRIWRK